MSTDSAKAIPVPITDETVDNLVAELTTIHRERSIDLALAIGETVVKRFYAGDVSKLHDRSKQDTSLRMLASHPDLPVSATSLYQSVALYEFAERTQLVSTCEHLGVSHYRLLLGLPEKAQKRLATQAEKHRWTVKKLEEKTRAERKKNPRSAGGRPVLPTFVKSIHALRKYADAKSDLFGDLEQLDGMDEKDAAELYQTVTGLKLRLAELQEKLQEKVPGFTAAED